MILIDIFLKFVEDIILVDLIVKKTTELHMQGPIICQTYNHMLVTRTYLNQWVKTY